MTAAELQAVIDGSLYGTQSPNGTQDLPDIFWLMSWCDWQIEQLMLTEQSRAPESSGETTAAPVGGKPKTQNQHTHTTMVSNRKTRYIAPHDSVRPAYGHTHRCDGCQTLFICQRRQHYTDPYRCPTCGPSPQELRRAERRRRQ